MNISRIGALGISPLFYKEVENKNPHECGVI
jgi:hypothetical protein